MPLSQTGMFETAFATSKFRNTGPACIAFGVVYTAAVAVLFDAPLLPAHSCAWSACTKLALMAIAAVGTASRHKDLRNYCIVIRGIGSSTFTIHSLLPLLYDCLALASWLGLFAI